MQQAMDHNTNISSPAVLGVTILMNLIAFVDRGTVTFVLGIMVSILAMIHYALAIRKIRKEEREGRNRQEPPSLN
jgi:O-antigen/teichoic acid export membrane protein